MKIGFRHRIYLGIVSLLLLLGVVIFLVVSTIVKEALLEENLDRGVSMAGNLAARAAEPILAMDFLRMKNLVDETAQMSDDIYYTFILDADGKPLAHTFKGGFPVELKNANSVSDEEQFSRRLLDTGTELVYDYAMPVFVGGNRLGAIRIGLLRTRMENAVNRLLWTTYLSTGLVIALAAFVGTALARTVTRPIRVLHESSERAMRGDLEVHTAPLLRKNCWEIMNCRKHQCPAYEQVRFRCWYLVGTLCPYCVEGEYAKKIDSCKQCPVYRKCSGDEIQSLAEAFDCMAASLRKHISELRDTEGTLTEQRQLLKTILDATLDFVSLQDRRSVYKAANRAFCELVGKSEEEIIGKTDFDLFPRRRAENNRWEDLRILQSGEPLEKENEIAGSKGRHWLHMVKLPVRDADGEIVGLLSSGRDITELKRMQERLTQAQKMEAVGRLTAGIAHELNTPLGIILGYAQLLRDETQQESQLRGDLATIEKHAKICRKIVSDLLGFSRRTEGSPALLDVNAAIEEVLGVVEHTFSLERVHLVRRFDPDIPAIVADKEKLLQALMNLVNNAFDAIGSDGHIVLATSFDKERSEVVISVADTGCGIPPEHIDKIFDPFFTTKVVGKGTGLGLSVTFGIVKELGGGIEVRSPVPDGQFEDSDLKDRGAVFTVYLPVDADEGVPGREDDHGEYSGIG